MGWFQAKKQKVRCWLCFSLPESQRDILKSLFKQLEAKAQSWWGLSKQTTLPLGPCSLSKLKYWPFSANLLQQESKVPCRDRPWASQKGCENRVCVRQQEADSQILQGAVLRHGVTFLTLHVCIPMGGRTHFSRCMSAPEFFLQQAKQTVDMNSTVSASLKQIVSRGHGAPWNLPCWGKKNILFWS